MINLTAPSQKTAKTGVVYFLRADNGLVKIGYTTNLKLRLKTVSTSCSSPIDVMRTEDGSIALERAFHKMFEAYRVRLEWFRFAPEMLTKMPSPEHYLNHKKRGFEERKSEHAPAIYEIILKKFSEKRGATKILAEMAGASSRTAEAWIQGRTPPSFDNLISLAAADKDFELLIIQLIAGQREKRLRGSVNTEVAA